MLFKTKNSAHRLIGEMLFNWSTIFFSTTQSLKNGLPTARSCRFKSSKPAIPKPFLDAIRRKAEDTLFQFHHLKSKQNVNIGSVSISHLLSGLHGSRLLICETSEVDAMKGIYYRGVHIEDLVKRLPGKKCYLFNTSNSNSLDDATDEVNDTKLVRQNFPYSEGLFWLLLSGEIPNDDSIALLQHEFYKRRVLPQHVLQILESLPPYLHPMNQFIIGIMACQMTSKASDLIRTGYLSKSDYWIYFLEDGLSLISKASSIASIIYHRFKPPKRQSKNVKKTASVPLPLRETLDWAGNVSRGLGFDSSMMENVMRLHMFLHADHEGGNVSAHAGHLVGSALSDPFLCFAASLTGLAGPLHGMANQTCLQFLKTMQEYLRGKKKDINDQTVALYIQKKYLNRNRIVPGFGHAVLRTIDPRFRIQHNFFKAVNERDSLGRLLNIVIRVVPPLLSASGKVSNPYPNIDAHSGVILNHYGIVEPSFFTVLFGLSRSLGIISQLVWDRILQLPIERPKSITLEKLNTLINRKSLP